MLFRSHFIDGPSNPPQNFEDAKYVTVLRSGKEIDKTIHPKHPTPRKVSIPTIQLQNPSAFEPPHTGESSNTKDVVDPSGLFVPILAPYPHWLRGPTKFTHNIEVYKKFKQVKISIPF